MLSPGGRPLEDQVVLVTGATGSLGSAVTLEAAGAGARVVASGRDSARLASLLAACHERAGAVPPVVVPTDVRREPDAERLRDTALARFGRIDALVVAHGIGRRPEGRRLLPEPFARLPLAEWRAVVDTNLTGAFLAARAVIPAMRERGGGAILFLGSARGGRRGQAFGAPYCASKFALRGLAEALAEEVGRDGIRVTLLQPEAVHSPLIADTRLGAGPFRAMAPERLGELVVALLAMPAGARLPEPLFASFTSGSGAGVIFEAEAP